MPRLCIVLWDRQCLLYLWKMFKNLRNELGSWTRTTTTSYQCQAMSSKRTPFAVPNMDLLSGNQCTCKAHKLLQEACQPKHGEYKSIHERWHKDDQYRNSLSLIGWTEEQIIEHDKIALEDHSYVATKPERIQNTKLWVLRLNQDGAQQPLNQRPDLLKQDENEKRMDDEHVKKRQQEYRPIPRDQQSRQRRGQAFEGIHKHDYRVDPRTDWRFYNSESQGNLSHSSSSTTWDRNNWTTRSWKSWHSSRSDSSWFFSAFRTNFGCREKK